MFILKAAAALTLASIPLVQSVPPAPPKKPVEYVEPQPAAPAINLFQSAEPAAPAVAEANGESFVTVEGLNGKLLVLPSIMQQYQLNIGQTISQEMMYRLLEFNQKLY